MAAEQKASGRRGAPARTPPPRKAASRPPPARKVAVPEPGPGGPSATAQAPASGPSEPPRLHEPVWLVRIVLVLFLVGFAAFLAREIRNLVSVLP